MAELISLMTLAAEDILPVLASERLSQQWAF